MDASKKKARTSEFEAVFRRLRRILEPHAGKFVVSVDKPNHYCLGIPCSPKFGKSFPIAWVKISTSYVGFHFMPIYFAPTLQKNLSAGLKARMQGKSCFNFKAVDDELFEELKRLTAAGFQLSKKGKVF